MVVCSMSIAGVTSASIAERAAAVIPGGLNTSLRRVDPPMAVARAKGQHFEDVEGRRYLDYHCGFGAVVLGHGHPRVTEAVQRTLGGQSLFGIGVTEMEAALAERIVHHVPSVEQVLFTTSGSDSVMHAIRLARAVTGRTKVVKFQGCFHGGSDYVLLNTTSSAAALGRIDPGSAGMLPAALEHTLVCRFNDLAGVATAVAANPGQIAALIVEPIAHNAGCILPTAEFLGGLRSLCDRAGIVLVFDEVITGFRHALGGYQSICGVRPDLTTMGKAIANGFPLAALGGRRELMERFTTHPGGDVFYAGTYNAHPVGLAAALATLEVMETEPVHERLFALGERMRAGLERIAARLDVPLTVAGFGSVYLAYFMDGPVRSYDDVLRNDAATFVAHRNGMVRRGVFELPVNIRRCYIGYSHSEADVDRTLVAAEESLAEVSAA
jgi:glutamate-1-semialdehyde 2,1-aminomutase